MTLGFSCIKMVCSAVVHDEYLICYRCVCPPQPLPTPCHARKLVLKGLMGFYEDDFMVAVLTLYHNLK